MKLFKDVEDKLKEFGITVGDLYYRDSVYFKGYKEYLINVHMGDDVKQLIIPFAEEDKETLDNNRYTSYTIFDNALSAFFGVGDIIEEMSADRYEAIHEVDSEFEIFKEEVLERRLNNEQQQIKRMA